MNGLIWQAIYNVINAYNMVEMQSIMEPGQGSAAITHAPDDIYVRKVGLLEDTVLSVEKPDDLYRAAIMTDYKGVEKARVTYRAVLSFLHRKGHLRFKPPRDFADD